MICNSYVVPVVCIVASGHAQLLSIDCFNFAASRAPSSRLSVCARLQHLRELHQQPVARTQSAKENIRSAHAVCVVVLKVPLASNRKYLNICARMMRASSIANVDPTHRRGPELNGMYENGDTALP